MAKTSALPVFLGLASGIALIALFSTIGTNALLYYPRYDLGAKDELISKLSEYFGREPDNTVLIENEIYQVIGNQDSYDYKLIAAHDSKVHGRLSIGTYNDKMNVFRVGIVWEHDGDPNLRKAGDLVVSGIADNAIPDWQMDDGQPNRNVQMLIWIHANTNSTQRTVVKDDFSQQRILSMAPSENGIFLVVSSTS